MNLRTGYSTGACATAATKAAAMLLCTGKSPAHVELTLPTGELVVLALSRCEFTPNGALAAVCKDAGDDPDVTHGATVIAEVAFRETDQILFTAGPGVGTVTKPGLQVPPGEPAINPVPRQMMRDTVRAITSRGLEIRLSIPGGAEIAARTFNPRLGITGGLSIIGTTGIVKPFSAPALKASLQCALDVAAASGIRRPVLVPGNIGERAARRHFSTHDGQVIQVSNHWGFMLDAAVAQPGFEKLLIIGHPGKLAKLIDGEWDTHSSNSSSAVESVSRLARSICHHQLPECTTVEGIFASLPTADSQALGTALAQQIHRAILCRTQTSSPMAVVLINVAGDVLATTGDTSPWK